jgi:hypothetical protein
MGEIGKELSMKKTGREIKWFFQRLFRGYSQCDLWNLPQHLAKILLPRIKAFRRMRRMSYYSGEGMSSADWEEVLRKIEWALTFYYKGEEPELFPTLDYVECHRRAEEGMTLFGKYFAALWD